MKTSKQPTAQKDQILCWNNTQREIKLSEWDEILLLESDLSSELWKCLVS